LREGIGMGAVCIINLLKDTGEEQWIGVGEFSGIGHTHLGLVIKRRPFLYRDQIFPYRKQMTGVCKKKIPSLRSL
jgi:hypothetical protein